MVDRLIKGYGNCGYSMRGRVNDCYYCSYYGEG